MHTALQQIVRVYSEDTLRVYHSYVAIGCISFWLKTEFMRVKLILLLFWVGVQSTYISLNSEFSYVRVHNIAILFQNYYILDVVREITFRGFYSSSSFFKYSSNLIISLSFDVEIIQLSVCLQGYSVTFHIIIHVIR